MKIFILGDHNTTVCACQLPDVRVRRTAAPEQPHVECVGKHVGQVLNQCF